MCSPMWKEEGLEPITSFLTGRQFVGAVGELPGNQGDDKLDLAYIGVCFICLPSSVK